MACLNGGPAEVIRVATAGLVDRGLLQLIGDTATAAPGVVPDMVEIRIERDCSRISMAGRRCSSAVQRWDLRAVAHDYEHRSAQ